MQGQVTWTLKLHFQSGREATSSKCRGPSCAGCMAEQLGPQKEASASLPTAEVWSLAAAR